MVQSIQNSIKPDAHPYSNITIVSSLILSVIPIHLATHAYVTSNEVIKVAIKADAKPEVVFHVFSEPEGKTGSKGLPPPDEPRPGCTFWSSSVSVALGVLVVDTVVVLASSTVVVVAIGVSVSLIIVPMLVELSVLLDVDVMLDDEFSVVVSIWVVFVLSISVIVEVEVEVASVWLGVKKVRVVVGVTIEVTEVA